MFLGSTGHRVAIALAVAFALVATLVCGAIWFGYLPTGRATQAETKLTQVQSELTDAEAGARSAQATATELAGKLSECERKLTPTPAPETEGEGLFAGVGASAGISETTTVTDTYPVLTWDIVKPWIERMGANGHPGHDTAGNEQCAYWLDPKYLPFADDVGPNTSGIETAKEGVFEFDMAAIADYKKLPADYVFLTESAWAQYHDEARENVFIVTPGRDKILLSGGAIFALHPESVEPFLALRVAHIACRGYQNTVVDYRDDKLVVTTPVPVSPAPSATPMPGETPPAAPTATNPSDTGINATYEFGTTAKGSVDKAHCVELKGGASALSVDLKSGGFAVSGRESEATDWQIAKSSGAGKYSSNWTGWLLCFDADPAKAEALLVQTDGNAKGNERVTWSPTK